MNQEELKNAIAVFYPALLLDRCIGRENRLLAEKTLRFLAVGFFILAAAPSAVRIFKMPGFQGSPWIQSLEVWYPMFLGLLFITLSLWFIVQAFEAFYDSYYFKGFKTILPESGLSDQKITITFEAAQVLCDGIYRGDFTGAFIRSKLGHRALVRLAIKRQALEEFLSERLHVAAPEYFKFKPRVIDRPVSLEDVAAAVAEADTEFFKFLSLHAVTVKDFTGSAAWMGRMEEYFRRRDRFWGKDSLGIISGIGKDWAQGGAYTLEKFAHDITDNPVGGFESSDILSAQELDGLEAILARSSEANALLVAEEGAGAFELVSRLAAKISQGSVLPPLEHKRIFLFDANAFTAFAKDKAKFESKLLHILNESVRAGNIILVLSDLPGFIESAKSIGSDVVALMDPYLASSDFQVIAMANPEVFHQGLEGNSRVLHRFEKILVKERDEETTMGVLEGQALIEESKNPIFFTYQSLSAVAEAVKRYFTEGVASDKALHLLSEAVPEVLARKGTIVERKDILRLVEAKTGIRTGTVTGGERDILLNLENILHERIIGQDEAVKAISGALRRARSDITNPERPMGSFLFLGPTGVGKTETTKALAATFFGKEETVIRLDMSEYRTDDALKRLIGSFEGGKVGVLASRLREQSYGVLLLDEFEKTNKEVLDLFLQILDEGFFSDMSGKRVNARNLIIIATSNAGSDLIWNLMRAGKDLTAEKDSIITEIINRGIFKPELLNRFDGVILFHPLSAENLQKIAGLMLQKLVRRLAGKGIELVVNDVLVKAVMSAGVDPEFGARPMNRAIQEKVEQVIAHKIISGEAPSGSRIELTEAELA